MTILKPIKTFFTLSRILLHLITGILLASIFAHGSVQAGTRAARLFCWWQGRLSQLFNIQYQTFGQANTRPTLFIANHISWFDIPAIGANLPVRFLSKQEVKHWPLIGWLARKVGTLFIQRGRKGAAEQSIYDITHALQQGDSVIIFPEGTTTDGTDIKKFHSRLFQAAINAGVDVQAIAILYPGENGIHPDAAYVGDMSMMESVNNFIHSKDIKVDIHFLDIFSSQQYSRDELTALCAEKIAIYVKEHHKN